MVTSSNVMVPHEPLLMVQRNVFVPKLNPETDEDDEDAFENVPVPAITVQAPVAGKVALLALSVVDV
jgi:hypothetical protein